MVVENEAELDRQFNELYARHVKPLEKEHWGEYAAVSPDGQLVLAPTLVDVMKEADRILPPGGFLYKVGEVVVDKWR